MGMLIGIGVLVVLIVILIGLYNGLVQLKIRADSAWSDIDVQLKRRHDLIPNLVETVKGYAAHEKGTFENVAKWRSAAMSATAPAERAQAEGQLTMALKSLFAVAEAYPQLRANENFMSLQNIADAHRGRRAELAPLLQRRGARLQHAHPDVSGQHVRRRLRLPAAPVLRTGNAGRPRSPQRQVLMSSGDASKSSMAWPRRFARAAGQRLRDAKSQRFVAPVMLVVLLACFAMPALARNWRIADFHSTVAIDDHGGTSVTERITLVFVGQYNGIWRSIPVEYPGPGGTNYSLFLKVDSVTDENERPLKYEVSRDGPYKKVKIYIPGAVDTTKTVLIIYSAPNAVRFFDDHDEFYWNVTGNDWPVPIDHASALVSLPEAAAGGLRAQAFTGALRFHQPRGHRRRQGLARRIRNHQPAAHARRPDGGRLHPQGHPASARRAHARWAGSCAAIT